MSARVFLAGIYELQGFYLERAETIGWGGGLVLGTITAIVLFIGPLEDKSRNA